MVNVDAALIAFGGYGTQQLRRNDLGHAAPSPKPGSLRRSPPLAGDAGDVARMT